MIDILVYSYLLGEEHKVNESLAYIRVEEETAKRYYEERKRETEEEDFDSWLEVYTPDDTEDFFEYVKNENEDYEIL